MPPVKRFNLGDLTQSEQDMHGKMKNIMTVNLAGHVHDEFIDSNVFNNLVLQSKEIVPNFTN